jgi:hypothetical protein
VSVTYLVLTCWEVLCFEYSCVVLRDPHTNDVALGVTGTGDDAKF